MRFFKKHKKKIISFIVLILVIVAYFFIRGNGADVLETQIIKKTSIRQIVDETGVVQPVQEAVLSFESTGVISAFFVEKGDVVKKGDILAKLEDSEYDANLNQAQANLKKAFAQYQDVKNGTKTEEINLQKIQVDKSVLDLANTKTSIINMIKDVYTKADDAISNLTDIFFDDPHTANAYFNVTGITSEELIDLSFRRRELESRLVEWYKRINILNIDSDLIKEYNLSLDNLFKIREYLNKMSVIVNSLTPDATNSATVLSGYRSNVSLARASVDLAINNLNSSFNNFKAGDLSLQSSQSQLVIKQDGSTNEQISSAEATYEAAQASLAIAQAQLNKRILRAPFSGVIADTYKTKGEFSSGPVLSLVSDNTFEIIVNITESDISNISLGDKANVRLDAYENEVFEAEVTFISPTAKLVEGVSVFETTLQFNKINDHVRAGLSADIEILAVEKLDVITVPNRAIIENDINDKYIRMIDKNFEDSVVEVTVTTGLRGSEGFTEVTSGLKEGDEIVTFISAETLAKYYIVKQ